MDTSQEALLNQERVADAFLCALPTTDTLSRSHIAGTLDTFVYRFISYYPTLHVPVVLSETVRASPDSTTADIFTCAACGQLFEDPVTLFCPEDSHTFCKNCVKDAHPTGNLGYSTSGCLCIKVSCLLGCRVQYRRGPDGIHSAGSVLPPRASSESSDGTQRNTSFVFPSRASFVFGGGFCR